MRQEELPVRAALEVDSPLGSVQMAGYQTKRGTWSEPRRFGRYAMVYLLEGEGLYADERGVEQGVVAGDLILIFPKLGHRYGPHAADDPHWHELFLVFAGPIFEQWEQAGLLDQDKPVWRIEPVELWQRRIESVLNPSMPTGLPEALQEVCRLQLLLADALQWSSPSSPELRSTWLANACGALEARTPLAEIAAQLHCSYATFRRRFTRLAGVSPGQYRSRLRIEQACALMHQTDLSDKQIAAELGFSDPYHFSRRFKQILGISPRAYRQSLP